MKREPDSAFGVFLMRDGTQSKGSLMKDVEGLRNAVRHAIINPKTSLIPRPAYIVRVYLK